MERERAAARSQRHRFVPIKKKWVMLHWWKTCNMSRGCDALWTVRYRQTSGRRNSDRVPVPGNISHDVMTSSICLYLDLPDIYVADTVQRGRSSRSRNVMFNKLILRLTFHHRPSQTSPKTTRLQPGFYKYSSCFRGTNRLYIKMDDMTAPLGWSQGASMTPLMNPASSVLMNGTWDEPKNK